MSWLRIDDGFTEHRKVVELKRVDRWTWMETLTYCARQNNGGHVPEGISDVLRYVTPAFLQRCLKIGLLDRDDRGGYRVHDWTIYNGPTLEAKIGAYLESNPNATANDVQRAIGGKRELVLAIVKRFQGTDGEPPEEPPREPPSGSFSGSQVVPEEPGSRFPSGSPGGSQVVHARANPIPLEEQQQASRQSQPEDSNGLPAIDLMLKEITP